MIWTRVAALCGVDVTHSCSYKWIPGTCSDRCHHSATKPSRQLYRATSTQKKESLMEYHQQHIMAYSVHCFKFVWQISWCHAVVQWQLVNSHSLCSFGTVTVIHQQSRYSDLCQRAPCPTRCQCKLQAVTDSVIVVDSSPSLPWFALPDLSSFVTGMLP